MTWMATARRLVGYYLSLISGPHAYQVRDNSVEHALDDRAVTPTRTSSLVLLNATHAVAGGGLIYLKSIVPELSRASDLRWILIAPKKTLEVLDIPPTWKTRASPDLGFFFLHAWEQLLLPIWALSQGVSVTLCNSNYVPFLAPRPIPILHTEVVEALQAAKTFPARFYWFALKVITELSLVRASHVLTTAVHLVYDYVGGKMLARSGRSYFAPPGVPKLPELVARDPNLIVAVGDIYPHKDYGTLIRAMAVLTQRRPLTKLEIIGDHLDKQCAQELFRLIEDLALKGQVLLTGPIAHGQLMRRMAQSTALATASLAETSNMVVIEAMSVGTPVVASDARFQREVAADAALYVSDSGDKHVAFSQTLFELLESPALQADLRERGHRRSAQYDWTKTAATILECTRCALNRKSESNSVHTQPTDPPN
jgi:glycosyltransferase involved in cell wall biosynthesis